MIIIIIMIMIKQMFNTRPSRDSNSGLADKCLTYSTNHVGMKILDIRNEKLLVRHIFWFLSAGSQLDEIQKMNIVPNSWLLAVYSQHYHAVSEIR